MREWRKRPLPPERESNKSDYDANPMQGWDFDKWDEYDSAIDIAFHQRPVFFTPLCNYVSMPNGADTYYTGNELLRGHTNYNTIGNRARYIDAMYVDGRKKKLVADKRYAGKFLPVPGAIQSLEPVQMLGSPVAG